MLDSRHKLLCALQNSLSIDRIAVLLLYIKKIVTIVRQHRWSVLGLGPQLADIRAKPYSHRYSVIVCGVLLLGGMLSYRRVKHLIQFCLLFFTQLVSHFEEHAPLIFIQPHDALSADIASLHDLAHSERIVNKCLTPSSIHFLTLTLFLVSRRYYMS